MPETPPPVTSSPTASEPETEDQLDQANRPQPPAVTAPTASEDDEEEEEDETDIIDSANPWTGRNGLVVNRDSYDSVLLELRRLNDSGDCGRMVEGIVSKMEGWNQ